MTRCGIRYSRWVGLTPQAPDVVPDDGVCLRFDGNLKDHFAFRIPEQGAVLGEDSIQTASAHHRP